MNVQELKERALASVDLLADEIVDHANRLLALPEIGFREWRTHDYLLKVMERIPFHCVETQSSIPGIKATLQAVTPGSTIAVLADMDAVPDAVDGDSARRARHSCGHYAQGAHMLGCAAALAKCGILSELRGSVAFLACPAEEYVDLAWRYERIADQTIRGISGKLDFWEKGWFKGIGGAISVHLADDLPAAKIVLPEECDGVCAFDIVLAAYSTGLSQVSPRENRKLEWIFRSWLVGLSSWTEIVEWDMKIIETEKQSKNCSVYRLTCLWTGKSPSSRIKEALLSFGSERALSIDVRSYPDYEPLCACPKLQRIVKENAALIAGPLATSHASHIRGATDLGNISQKIPVIHPFVGGTSGHTHTPEFCVVNEYTAYVLPVKLLCAVIIDWLTGEGRMEISQ